MDDAFRVFLAPPPPVKTCQHQQRFRQNTDAAVVEVEGLPVTLPQTRLCRWGTRALPAAAMGRDNAYCEAWGDAPLYSRIGGPARKIIRQKDLRSLRSSAGGGLQSKGAPLAGKKASDALAGSQGREVDSALHGTDGTG